MNAQLALLILLVPAVAGAQLPRAVWFQWNEPNIAILPDSSGTYFWVQTGASSNGVRTRILDVTFEPAKVSAWIGAARALLTDTSRATDTASSRTSEILHGTAGDGLYVARQRANGAWSNAAILSVESPRVNEPVIIHGEATEVLRIVDSLGVVAARTPYSDAAMHRRRAELERKFDTPVRPDRGNMPPTYPIDLLRSGQDGLVIISFVVSALGKVDLASVRPFLVTHPAFLDAVITALPFMKFYPAVHGGGEVESRVTMPFQFAVVKRRGR